VPSTDTLVTLAREGRLVDEYPQMEGLLADCSDADLHRAGRLLSRLDPEEVLERHPGTPVLSVAVTGHGTVSALIAPLTAETGRHGLLLRPHLTDFDTWVFELSDPSSGLYATQADLTLCVLDPMVVFDEVPVPWGIPDIMRVIEDKLTLIDDLVRRFDSSGTGLLVLNTIPLPRRFTAQLVDHRSRAALGVAWREMNVRLLKLGESYSSATVIDLDPLISEGIPVADTRLSIYAKAHLSEQLLCVYAHEIAQLGRHVSGRTKKVLVLDLDETLWGGVLSDDGIDGIELAETYRGEAFTAFQRVVRQIGAQGVALAIVSKNDAGPVAQVLRDHPRMVLRSDHFVKVTANWLPKHDNLSELAHALNLSLDSFVFVDDSAFECGLVRRELPEVAVVQLDEEPALHIGRLLGDGWFDVREVTAQDHSRTAQYRSELVRQDLRRASSSIENYLRELEIRVDLSAVGEPDVARISQLTLRTNQFNFTTRRLQPADVRNRLADPAEQILAIRSADRFGENGLVGAIFVRQDNDVLTIDNFVLSCRVFSRGIEVACLTALLEHARSFGAKAVVGRYRRSPKNQMVQEFYPSHGFESVARPGSDLTFVHDLDEIISTPGHLSVTTTLAGVRS